MPEKEPPQVEHSCHRSTVPLRFRLGARAERPGNGAYGSTCRRARL